MAGEAELVRRALKLVGHRAGMRGVALGVLPLHERPVGLPVPCGLGCQGRVTGEADLPLRLHQHAGEVAGVGAVAGKAFPFRRDRVKRPPGEVRLLLRVAGVAKPLHVPFSLYLPSRLVAGPTAGQGPVDDLPQEGLLGGRVGSVAPGAPLPPRYLQAPVGLGKPGRLGVMAALAERSGGSGELVLVGRGVGSVAGRAPLLDGAMAIRAREAGPLMTGEAQLFPPP